MIGDNHRLPFVDSKLSPWLRFLYIALIFYFFTFIFEAPVRFLLSRAGFGSALYLRDFIPVVTVFMLVVHWAANKKQPAVILVFISLLIVHSLISMFYQKGIFQQIFGAKIFLPIIFGMSVAYYRPVPEFHLKRFVIFVIVVAAIGVFVNYFIRFPWEGEEFSTAFGATEQSRVWTAGGVRRLSGFSRASFDAASVILLSSVMLLVWLDGIFVRLIVFCFGAIAIAMTTTKGALLALIVSSCVYAFKKVAKSNLVPRAALVATAIFVVIIPLLTFIVSPRQRDIPQEYWWLTSSFVDRMEWMWPRAFDLLIMKGNILFGRGPGGIGVSQLYFEWRDMNAGDNVFVYLFVTFGVVGLFYFSLFVKKAFSWGNSDTDNATLGIVMMLAVLAYGLTANVIEQPILAFCFGFWAKSFFEKNGQLS